MSFKVRLREARTAKNLSQEFVANILGVTRQAVGNWESEKSASTPDPDTLAKLADLYEVSVDWILGRQPPTFNPKGGENTPLETQIVRAAAESGDLSGWSDDMKRRLELQIRIAKEVIFEEEDRKKKLRSPVN